MSWLFSDTDEGPRSTRWSFVTGMIVGALALASLWVAVAITAGSSGEGDGSELPTVLGTETADAYPSTGEAAADVCVDVHRAQTPALRAAEASVAGWTVHVNTMNQLVAGDIAPGQVTDLWERTRSEATDLLEDYDEAAARYDAVSPARFAAIAERTSVMSRDTTQTRSAARRVTIAAYVRCPRVVGIVHSISRLDPVAST